MQHKDTVDAIQFIRPNAQFILSGDDLQWLDTNQIQPTEAEIKAGRIAYEKSIALEAEAKAATKASALAKLAALGLSADEIAAL